ncbi:hypothetical protein PPTG_20210 [Phytophthora nicotianae INRA-310]|uniref:Uncharacterized protein n=1 Tax=Phytophthora nicotianae (strain INRA-310) TaxID=761204 RepID=W2P9S0_PHYN3|nr:hypothetical protein PPTG_20210 [Phytophthora nicotianae INRA-310]ETM97576.1 hypothetical protein PPTG_20210 [Phytophthora nicotianae INRA-310]
MILEIIGRHSPTDTNAGTRNAGQREKIGVNAQSAANVVVKRENWLQVKTQAVKEKVFPTVW